MIRQLQWLILLVLSATRKTFKYFSIFGKICIFGVFIYSITVFVACNGNYFCDCTSPGPCFTDTEPPNPLIQLSLFDERGKPWYEWQGGNVIDTIIMFNEQKKQINKRDTSKFSSCYKDICFRFDEIPNRETIDKFVTHTYFLDLYIKDKGWDRDTLIVAYKSDKQECVNDSIDFKYNDIFKYTGKYVDFSNASAIIKKI